jgi:hypothetical protein
MILGIEESFAEDFRRSGRFQAEMAGLGEEIPGLKTVSPGLIRVSLLES